MITADRTDKTAMISHQQVSRRRFRSSCGQAILESAFIMLPLFALISAFFDTTFALFDWTTLQNATREGVRYAITFQTMAGKNMDASIAQTVVNNSMGLLTSSTPVDSTTSGALSITTNYFTQINPNTPIASPGGNTPGNIVEVSVLNYPLQWMIPIAGTFISPYRSQSPASINVYARDVLNGYPAGVTSVNR